MRSDAQITGTTKNRTSVTVPMSPDFKARITKAAGRNEVSTVRYIRTAVERYMKDNAEYSLPGPTKGAA